MKTRAPWTAEEVDALNLWQQRTGFVREFVCPNDGEMLVAKTSGWNCPRCRYRQDWAHEAMLRVMG